MLIYEGPDGRRVDVCEWESVKRRVLEGMGWRLVAGPVSAPQPAAEPAGAALLSVDGIGPEIAGALVAMGIDTPDALRAATDDALLGVPGINARRLKRIRRSLEQ